MNNLQNPTDNKDNKVNKLILSAPRYGVMSANWRTVLQVLQVGAFDLFLLAMSFELRAALLPYFIAGPSAV
jgi:putative hemolysin